MTNLVQDRVLETTTTQGTGTLNLAGATSAFRAFADVFATGAKVVYCITQDAAWEIGFGTLTTGSPDTLSRDTVLGSSNSGAAVDWGSGTKNVFCGIAAEMLAALSDSLSKSVAGGSDVTLTVAESYTLRQTFTGTLTGNINVVEKAEMKRLIVAENSTSGAFTLTVKTAAGTGIAVAQGRTALLYCDGTDIVDVGASLFLADLADDASPQLGGTLDTNGHQVRWSKGADVASPAGGALTLGADGNNFDITGTNAITSIGTLGVGTVVKLHFDAALTLTHHATGLVLPGGANITTAAGDEAEFVEYATGDWRCTNYVKASGQAVAAASMPRSYLTGLRLSHGGSASITVGAGSARDDGDTADMVLASDTAKTSSAWAVGSTNGGLDTGTIANFTWYHVWLIKRSDTGVVDALFSTSATAPTMPANYDLKRRIGAVLTGGSANFLSFVQRGDTFLWNNPPLDINLSATITTSATLAAISVPTGFNIKATIIAGFEDVSADAYVYISSPVIGDEAATSGRSQLSEEGRSIFNRAQIDVLTDTSARIRIRSNVATIDTFNAYTVGWVDRRGKDD